VFAVVGLASLINRANALKSGLLASPARGLCPGAQVARVIGPAVTNIRPHREKSVKAELVYAQASRRRIGADVVHHPRGRLGRGEPFVMRIAMVKRVRVDGFANDIDPSENISEKRPLHVSLCRFSEIQSKQGK
jgi:hypothetical protein